MFTSYKRSKCDYVVKKGNKLKSLANTTTFRNNGKDCLLTLASKTCNYRQIYHGMCVSVSKLN